MNSFLKIRPFQLILLIVFVFMAFGGLFLFSTFSGTHSGKQIGTVVIWGTLPKTAVQNELAQLTTSNKAYSGVSYTQMPADSFDFDLANAIAAGSGPDMIIISQEQLVGEKNKINLIPYSDSLPKRSFTDTTYLPEFGLFSTDTGTYGVPYVLDPLVLYYNKDILTSSGVTVPPTTWEGIVGLAPTLSKSDQTQTLTQSTVPFGTYSNVTDARGILSLLFLQAGSPITQAAQTGVRSVLADNSTQAADGTTPAQSVLNFYTQFSDPSRTVYSWNTSFDTDRQQFISGNLAFYVGFASEEPTIQAANPNLNFNMSAIPQPQTAKTPADYGLAYVFAIPKQSKNAAGALATALALTDKSALPASAQALSMAPAQRALLTASATDVYSPVYYPLALMSQGWLSPLPSDTDRIFSAMITSVASGHGTPAVAISTAAQALTAALAQ